MKRHIFFTFLLWTLLLGTTLGRNVVSIPTDLTCSPGKTIAVPVLLENTGDVVAVQFDVHLSYALATGDSIVKSRMIDHSLLQRNLGYYSGTGKYRYRYFLYSDRNTKVLGTAGAVMYFNVPLPEDLANDTKIQIDLKNIVISDRNGKNIADATTGQGIITVSIAPHPDILPVNPTITETLAEPGDDLHIRFQVKNQGELATGAGWTEKYWLEDEDGNRVFVGQSAFEGTLDAQSSVERSATITLSELPGVNGDLRPVVTLYPAADCGEIAVDKNNNTAVGKDYSLYVKKYLYVTAYARPIPENSGSNYACEVRRTGNVSEAQTFSVTAQDREGRTDRLTIANDGKFTFAQGANKAYFYVRPVDNEEINVDGTIFLTINPLKNNGYNTVEESVTIEENDKVSWSITPDKTDYEEGETIRLTINANRPYQEDLVVSLNIEKPGRFRLPTSVVIPVGVTEQVVEIPILNDNTPSNDQSIKITATADRYDKAEALFILHDNDVPAISLSLTPTTVSEGAGPSAMYATLTRSGVTDNKITIRLTDDSEQGDLYYSTRTITLPAGTTTANFPLGVVDNAQVDGDRTVNLKAAVYISDCSCDAVGDRQGVVSVPITITDNDGPMLTLRSSASTVLEGDAQGVTLTVSRNTAPESDLAVQLVTDAEGVTLPASVTIPAGQKSVTTNFIVPANETEEGDRTVSILAKSDGYSLGSCWLLISDRTLPDATLTEAVLSTDEVAAGGELTLSLELSNIGAASLPEGTLIKVLANDKVMTTYNTQVAVAKGASSVFRIPLKASAVPGTYRLSATVNDGRQKSELLYLNNSIEVGTINVTSLYQFNISAASDRYNAEETVHLSGQLTLAGGGTPAEGTRVEVYTLFNGVRTALDATTDKAGQFSADYVLPAGWRGHFSYGACNPGEEKTDEMGTFDVYGFERTSTAYIKHQCYKDEPVDGSFLLRNLSNLPLTNLQTTVTDASGNYELTLHAPTELAANATGVEVTYTLLPKKTSRTSNWDPVNIQMTTAEGASYTVTLYCYTNVHTPKLTVNQTSINTTATKGVSRTYPLLVTNTGIAETGKISISLPSGFGDFISLATPAEMPSLATGDTATVMLRFNPSADYDVNLIQRGSIGINCENGNGVSVAFSVKVVSEATGTLNVKVRDENTIYGTKDGNHPYVSDATVELRDYNTGSIVRKLVTGTEGSIQMADVPEGYYQLYVTAPKHDSYRGNVVVSPAETKEELVTLSYQAISVSWDVVETEVEDEYEIVTTVTYETQVPVPVVRMTAPDSVRLDLIEPGRSTLFNIVLRNDGLIAAQNVCLSLFEVPGFTVMPLVPTEGLTIGAECSMTFPIRITREQISGTSKRAPGDIPCTVTPRADYEWPCGEDSRFGYIQTAVNTLPKSTECRKGGIVGGTIQGGDITGGIGHPYEQTPSAQGVQGSGTKSEPSTNLLCDILCCVPDVVPYANCGRALYNLYKTGEVSVSGAIGCAIDIVPASGKLKGAVSCLLCFTLPDGLVQHKAPSEQRVGSSSVPSSIVSYARKVRIVSDYYNYVVSMLKENLNTPQLIDALGENTEIYAPVIESIDLVNAELDAMKAAGTLYNLDLSTIPDDYQASQAAGGQTPAEGKLSGEHLTALMPSGVANWVDFRLRDYVERVINDHRIASGLLPWSENHTSSARMEALNDSLDDVEKRIVAEGCVTLEELVASANNDLLVYNETESQGVCATVKLEFDQKLVMTRQAFRGTLTVENNSNSTLNDVSLNVLVTNLLGQQATSHEMQINFEKIEGFTGTTDGPWTLAPKTKGVATILFIPTKYAAPDTLTTYSFGGNLYFAEGEGEVQMRPLTAVKLQVKPSPVLDLTYFMQRDIYGDNPMTKDEVEPIVPAEFSVLIFNKGKGDATNVRMLTQQPKIIENEKGLIVDFAIASSSLNGGEKALALDSTIATQFGNIPSGTASYATWDLTSSLLGHFKEYSVSATHVTSYGNPDLSLLDEVTIHELIHSVDVAVGDTTLHAWLVNDLPDAFDQPDRIYLMDGSNVEVTALSEATLTPLGNSTFRLEAKAPQRGWYYAAVTDPTAGKANILGVKNGAGNTVDKDCCWQTQYTMQDGNDPLRDDKLHLVFFAEGPTTISHEITFEPIPDVLLTVTDIQTLPDENDIAENVIEQLTVTFSKPINAATFTREDIVVRREGNILDVDIPIVKAEDSDSIFTLNTAALSSNGYYTLQVKPEGLIDNEGFPGYVGKVVKWMLFKDGLIHYNVAVWDGSAGLGNVTSDQSLASDSHNYSASDTIRFTAIPAYGYNFSHWGRYKAYDYANKTRIKHKAPGTNPENDDLEKYSTENPISVTTNNDFNLHAVFEPKKVKVEVVGDANAMTTNLGTGFYDYGTVINFEAAAKDGYTITGFVVNEGEPVASLDEVNVDSEDPIRVEVLTESLGARDILLQETVDYTPEYVRAANVKIFRSFRKGTWNTITLPCAVSNPAAVFGEGTVVAKLEGVENNVMQFTTVSTMVANTPYLIKVGSIERSSLAAGAKKSSFYNVTATSIQVPEEGDPCDVQPGCTFVGSYVNRTIDAGAGNYYISSDMLYYIDAAAVVGTGRFKGYFHATQTLENRIPISIDGTTDAIIEVPIAVEASSDIYTLSGLKVRNKGQGLKGLQPGIYISNGQKIMVR